jgi:hypothetical protein
MNFFDIKWPAVRVKVQNHNTDIMKNKDHGKQLNRDIHRQAVNERFPESNMTKDSRKDAEKVHEELGTKSISESVAQSDSKKSS